MTAIEERDGVRFYVDRTSPLQPIRLDAHPGLRRGVAAGHRDAGARRRPARLARRHRRAARGRRRARGLPAAGRRVRRRWRARGRARVAHARADRAGVGAAGAAGRGGGRSRRTPRGRSSTRRPPPRCCGRSRARSASTRPAAGNRPGRHGIWQRPVERRRFAAAPLLAAVERGRARRGAARRTPPHSSCRCPSSPRARRRQSATSPRSPTAPTREKKGLDRVLAAWRAARREGEKLVVAGLAGAGEDGRPLRRHARRATSTARCCAARACS